MRRWQGLHAIAVLFCLTCLVLPMAASAAVQQVRVVAVGVSDSLSEAEALALDYAKKRAVFLVANKLNIADASRKITALKPEEFAAMIRGTSVMRTKREGNRTYAEITVTVIDTELKRALKAESSGKEASITAELNRAVLLIPALVRKDKAELWEKTNALRAPVGIEALRISHGGLMLPAGDFDDLRLIDYNNALTVTAEEMKPMFARYGADEIVIAIATLGAFGTEDPNNVVLRRLTAEGVREELLSVPVSGQNERDEVRVQATAVAIAQAALQIATATSESQQVKMQAATKVPIVFRYATPKELADMQQIIRATPGVLQLSTPSIGLGEISGTVYFEGTDEQLREALVKQAVFVSRRANAWQVSMR
jgi:hypothetical protein